MKTERIVTSPGGDRVTVLDDETFVGGVTSKSEPSPQSVGQVLKLNDWQAGVLQALWHEGVIEDRSGRATALLVSAAKRYGAEPPSDKWSPFTSTSTSFCVDRELNGKRTYSIRLTTLPDRWYRRLLQTDSAEPDEIEPVEPTAPPRSLDADSAAEPAPDDSLAASAAVEDIVRDGPAPIELELSNAVATALLAQVVSIITAGTDTSAPMLKQLTLDVATLEERLGVQVAYVEKLRRQLRESGDEIAALKSERDGLRQRLRSAEHNLSVATGADAQRVIDAEVRKQLDKMMRQAPIRVNGAG